jgi:recombination protein RecA
VRVPVDPSNLDKHLGIIRKIYGDGAVVKGTEKPPLRRIPSGSLELDYAIGGGVPVGRWAHFFGPKASGKTLTAYNVIANAQAMGLKCAYYNIEKQFSEEWCRKHGIDTNALEVVEGTVIEHIGAKLETLLGSIHVHVLDSMAMAVAQEELAMKSDEWRPGISARVWGKTIRRVNERFDDAENTIIMINQTRAGFGYGSSEEPTGGKALEYVSRLSLAFRKSSWLYYNSDNVLDPDAKAGDTLTGDKEPDGIEYQVRVVKSSGFGKENGTARMRLDYATGQYDELWTLSKGALFHDLVTPTGKGSSWYTYGDKKVQGKNGVRELVASDKKLQDKIREKMFATAA